MKLSRIRDVFTMLDYIIKDAYKINESNKPNGNDGAKSIIFHARSIQRILGELELSGTFKISDVKGD